MTMVQKIVFSCLGLFIGGTGSHWTAHSNDPLTARFWISLAFAGLIPLGAYFVGLAQKSPWNGEGPMQGGANMGGTMRCILIVVMAGLVMAGCATGGAQLALPQHPEPQTLSEAVANLKGDVPIDLDAALAIAQAHNDELAIPCWPALKRFFTETTGSPNATADQIKGVFSAWEKARVERIAIEGKSAGGGTILPNYLKLGCAAMVQDDRNFFIRLAAMIAAASSGAPGAVGAVKGAVPVIQQLAPVIVPK